MLWRKKYKIRMKKKRKGMKKREMVKMARNFQCRYLWREERQRENPRE